MDLRINLDGTVLFIHLCKVHRTKHDETCWNFADLENERWEKDSTNKIHLFLVYLQ